MARTAEYDFHIFLTQDQHGRLQRVARAMRQTMTAIARSAIVGYLNSYEEEELGKADRVREKAKDRHDRRPSGLGISFDPAKPASTESPVLPKIPLGAIGSFTPDLKPIVEHVKEADTPEEKQRRLTTVMETLRALCGAKEAEALAQKVKTETRDGGLTHFLKSLLP